MSLRTPAFPRLKMLGFVPHPSLREPVVLEPFLSRLAAFEPRQGAEELLPNEDMRQAFEDYLKWAVETGRGPYYAFTTRNFD